MKKVKDKEIKTSIGGQAVLEGVMMRSSNCVATAVRDAEGKIRIETKKVKPPKSRNLFFRLPIIRGVYSFVQSLFGGTAVLLRASEVYGEGEPSKFVKWTAEKLKINVFSVVGAISLFFAIILAFGLFMFLPQALRIACENLFNDGVEFNVWWRNIVEGVIKILIFVSYILLVSLLKDIRRTFMYHGAEHKTISCYEKGLPLTVENAKKCTRVHDRCGTTFIVIVMIISIVVFALFESLVAVKLKEVLKTEFLYNFVRLFCKLAFLPIIAGISYEILKALSKTRFWLFYPLKLPGLLLQRLTTKEPTDDMIEVAITAFNEAKQMEDDPSTPEKRFVFAQNLSKLLADTKTLLKEKGIEEEAEAEWIISICLGIKRDQLNNDKLVSAEEVEKINKVVAERITGRPLWYCIGDTDFYGNKILVDERVLIPRPETELLCEEVFKCVNENSTVLDLCTGSGAIAITVAKNTNAKVTASDVSEKALELAEENAKINQANVNFIKSDMFNNIDGKFDVIVSNPPYIRSDEILELQKEVKNFEPRLALDGGQDGLDFYRIIANNCSEYLTSNGILLLECGYDQAKEISELLNNFSEVELIKDYSGIERIIKAKK